MSDKVEENVNTKNLLKEEQRKYAEMKQFVSNMIKQK